MVKRTRATEDEHHRREERSRWRSPPREQRQLSPPRRTRNDRSDYDGGWTSCQGHRREADDDQRQPKATLREHAPNQEVDGYNKKVKSYAEVTRGTPAADEALRARRRPPSPNREHRDTREDADEEWILVKSRKNKLPVRSNSISESSRVDGKLSCHKCARHGHSISKCTFEWFCYFCRGSGHISSACPKRVIASPVTSKAKPRPPPSVSEGSKTQESSAGERRVIQATVTPTPLIAEFEKRFSKGIIIKAQTGAPAASDISELLEAALVKTPAPVWVIQEVAGNIFFAHCNDEEIAKEAIRVKGLEGRDTMGLEFFVTFKWWSRDYGALKADCFPPVWIRLFNLPFHCWVRSGFQNVVRPFGMLMDIDRQTLTLAARKFARIKVGVANKSDIPSKILVDFDNVIYEVKVIVEIQKNVSFRDISFATDKDINGGDEKLEEEDEAQPLDDGHLIRSNPEHEEAIVRSNLFQTARQDRASQIRSQLDSNFRTVPLSYPIELARPHSTRKIAERQSHAASPPFQGDSYHRGWDNSTVQDGAAFGDFIDAPGAVKKATSAPKAQMSTGILKVKDDVGQHLVKSMGLLNEPWMGFTKDEIERSVKNAFCALIHSKNLIPDGVEAGHAGIELITTGCEQGPVGTITPIINKSGNTQATEHLQDCIQPDSENGIIGALEGIRVDNIVSVEETEGEDREVRVSVGSSSTKKFTEYQRKGKRQMLSTESLNTDLDGPPNKANKQQLDTAAGEGAQEARKKPRITERE